MKEGMKMPGFTAEASLYKVNKHFGMVSLPSAGTDGQSVQPQAIRIGALSYMYRVKPPMGCYLTPCPDPNAWDGLGLCMVCDSDHDENPYIQL